MVSGIQKIEINVTDWTLEEFQILLALIHNTSEKAQDRDRAARSTMRAR